MAFHKGLSALSSVYGTSVMLLVGMGYWIQGFRCFPWFSVNFFLKDVLAVDAGTLQIVQNTVNLPMVAKPVYGIVSDAVYIRGAHRIPYLVIGGCLQALSWGIIALMPAAGGSSVVIIATLLAMSNLGASMVDVANDALVAECAKKKKSMGELQSFAWFSTAAGGVVGNLTAALAIGRVGFKAVFGGFCMLLLFQVGKTSQANEQLFGLRGPHDAIVGSDKPDQSVPAPEHSIHTKKRSSAGGPINGSVVPFDAHSVEPTKDAWKLSSADADKPNLVCVNINTLETACEKEKGVWQQFTDLFRLVKQPGILYPLTWFMASYAMIPTLAGPIFYFQTQHLKVDPAVMGAAKLMGQVGLMGGSALYGRYLKHMPMRRLLASTQILLCVCMSFDIMLVKRVNVGTGIPDWVMVMGLSAYVDAINQFKVLPFMVLLGRLCPTGSEGALLAAFMSMQCLATIISGHMGVTLASLLHISSRDFSGLPVGILMQSLAALLPLFWISFIPETPRVSIMQQPHQGKAT